MKLNQKISFFASLVFSLFLVFTSTSFAQTSYWYRPTYEEFMNKVNGGNTNEMFGERYTHAQVYWIIYSLESFLNHQGWVGCVVGNPGGDATEIGNCLVRPNAMNTDPGPIMSVAQLNDTIISTKMASGVQWLADTSAKLKIIPEAYAQQGFGFRTLSPTLALWTITRNFAYSFLIIVILILAFMIMFRVKTSPQTVVTIQSAIPKVAIALILITFSYAIAGLIVDAAFLAQGIISAVVANSGISTYGAADIPTIFARINDPFQGMFSLGFIVSGYVIIATVAGTFLAAFTGTPQIIGGAIVVGAVIILLILLVTLIAFLRIAFMLLKTYVSIFLLVIVSPFIILFGTVNQGFGFSTWIKQMIANMSVFVTTTVVIIFAHFFVLSALPSGSLISAVLTVMQGLGVNVNPYGIRIGSLAGGAAQLPGMTGINNDLLGILVGIVTMLSIPSIAESVRSLIATGRAAPFGSGVGAAIGPVSGAGMGLASYQIGKRMEAAEYAAKAMGPGVVPSYGPWRAASTMMGWLQRRR